MTMKILCAASIVIGTAGLMVRKKVGAVLALPVALLAFGHASGSTPAILWDGESAYNRILVYERDGLRWLVLNDNHFFTTIEKVGSAESGFYLDKFALGPAIVPAKRLLVLGMGAGRSVKVTRAVQPDMDVDAVEIDPEVVRVAGQFFGLPQNDPGLRVHIADARPWLAAHARKWDLVHVDLFQGGPYVPFYLTTVEFFELVRSHMTEGGVLMVNVLDRSDKQELLGSVGATLKRVFPSVEWLPAGGGNHILLAFAQKRPLAETVELLKQASGPDWVQEMAQKAAGEIVEFAAPPGATIFTDDKAPVEEMTRRMLAESTK